MFLFEEVLVARSRAPIFVFDVFVCLCGVRRDQRDSAHSEGSRVVLAGMVPETTLRYVAVWGVRQVSGAA